MGESKLKSETGHRSIREIFMKPAKLIFGPADFLILLLCADHALDILFPIRFLGILWPDDELLQAVSAICIYSGD